jgi:hypothetical protein
MTITHPSSYSTRHLNIDGQGGSSPPSIEAANSSCAGAAEAVPIVNPVATDRSNTDMMITSEFFIVISSLINSNFSD